MMQKSKYFICVLVVLLLPGCFRTRAEIAREKEEKEAQASLQQEVVQYQQNLDRMQAEIGRLQGKLEEMEHQRKKEQASNREGTEKNVTDLKAQISEMQKSQESLFEEMKRLKEENVQLLKERQRSASNSSSTAPTKGASFQSALTAYKAKDYEAAQGGFRSYLEANAKGKKAMDAHYYLGDILYKQKSYADAIVEFAVVHEKSPATAWGRKSTLRIAESFKAMGKEKDAKAFAQILVQNHPNSSEAKAARKFLK